MCATDGRSYRRVISSLEAPQGQVHAASEAEQQARSSILYIRSPLFRSKAVECVYGPGPLWARCENRSMAHDDQAGFARLTAQWSGRNSRRARLRPHGPPSNQSRIPIAEVHREER